MILYFLRKEEVEVAVVKVYEIQEAKGLLRERKVLGSFHKVKLEELRRDGESLRKQRK